MIWVNGADHTMDDTAALAAISLEAVAMKNIFLIKKQETPDSEFSSQNNPEINKS